ncbi:hypothetical protein QVD17_05327 [Tagetes erecta]|uniref:Uncharacterized protein n=1 Tax=Tagetes erecta TaxID=13708 RepID=A0AAD8LH90_TARER|nr:hypothetical protein QVD17_05327 [Tagetes erecta]
MKGRDQRRYDKEGVFITLISQSCTSETLTNSLHPSLSPSKTLTPSHQWQRSESLVLHNLLSNNHSLLKTPSTNHNNNWNKPHPRNNLLMKTL